MFDESLCMFKTLGTRGNIIAIFLDFSKTFDRANHETSTLGTLMTLF